MTPVEGSAVLSTTSFEGSRRPLLFGLVAVFFLGQAGIIALYYGMASHYPPPPRLIVSDVACVPNGRAEMSVRVVQDIPPLLRRQYAGQDVRVVPHSEAGPQDQKLPNGATEASGAVRLKWQAPELTGNYSYVARMTLANQAVLEASFDLYALEATRPVVLVSISSLQTSGGFGSASSLPNATRTLDLLKSRSSAAIFYLDFSRAPDPPRARKWLSDAGFAPGPLHSLLRESETRDYAKLLKEDVQIPIQDRWKRIEWAVTDSPQELSAFASLGVRTLFVGPTRPAIIERSPKLFWAADWQGAEKILLKGG
ncbi:MAG: hypothetical protein AAF488_15445 [Planctomycetota bacterium]